MSNMVKIDYVIENMAPISFAEKSSESLYYLTKTFVPGTSLKGALAAKYIQDRNLDMPHEDEGFFNLFLSGAVKFLPAYPLGRIPAEGSEAFVLPLSLTRSKDKKQLKDMADGTLAQPGFKKLQGYAVFKQDEIYSTGVQLGSELHMSRASETERINGSSIDGKLFYYEYLEAGQSFMGSILVDDALKENIVDFIKKNPYLYLGRSKNAQYGKCHITLLPEGKTKKEYNPKRKLYLLAQTPYIPYESFNSIADVLAKLEDELIEGLSKFNIALKAKTEKLIFADTEEINGYVSVWGTRRERCQAITAGSLFEIDAADLTETAIATLQELLYKGFGQRTEDGFGQFRLWQPLGKNYDVASFAVNAPVTMTLEQDYMTTDKITGDKKLFEALTKELKLPKGLLTETRNFGKSRIDAIAGKKKRTLFIAKKGTEIVLDCTMCTKALLEELNEKINVGFGECTDSLPKCKARLYQEKTIGSYVEQNKYDSFQGSVIKEAKKILSHRILLEVKIQAEEDVNAISLNTWKTGKNIIHRLIGLMSSKMPIVQIRQELETNFKAKAVENIQAMKIFGGISLWMALHQEKQPYDRVDWQNKIGLDEAAIEGLLQDLGQDAFQVDKNALYREYWLWFLKSADKKLNDN